VYLSSYGGSGYKPWGVNATPDDSDDEIEVSISLADAYSKDNGGAGNGPYLNLQSYQLISPGADTDYGTAGEYNGSGVDATRPAERDNITNFKGGRLN